METHKEAITVRRTTADDKEAVLNIRGNVHRGMDFLDAYFDYLLSLPTVYPAVLCCGGKMNVIEVALKPRKIGLPSESDSLATDLSTVSDEDLAILFDVSVTRNYIAPTGTFLIHMVPFKPIKANIPSIRGIKGSTRIYSDVKSSPDKCSGLLSCRIKYSAPRGAAWTEVCFIDIFGDDPSSLKKHFTRHMTDISRDSTNTFGITIILPKSLQLESTDQVLTDLNSVCDDCRLVEKFFIHLEQQWNRNQSEL